MAHSCNPSIWEAEARRWLQVQEKPGLQGEPEASLNCIAKPYLRKAKEKKSIWPRNSTSMYILRSIENTYSHKSLYTNIHAIIYNSKNVNNTYLLTAGAIEIEILQWNTILK